MNAQLVLPPRFENGDVAVNLNLSTIDDRLARRHHRIAKNDARDLGALVFEREILVAGRLLPVVADLSLHPDDAHVALELHPESDAKDLTFHVLDPASNALSLTGGKGHTQQRGWHTVQVTSTAASSKPFKLAVTYTSTQFL